MKRIVVTGATSMIGAAIIKECATHGIEIFAAVRPDSGKKGRLPEGRNVHLVEVGLDELQKLPEHIGVECDTFYHIAWVATGINRDCSTELQSRNIRYTLDAVNAAKAIGCGRFIGAGSQAEYGLLNLEKISPDSPVNPITPYGAAKLSAGYLARMRCRELEMECIWPRIFSVYGIYEKETAMVASALRKMIKGEAAEFTPAMQRWDYLYSKDAGRAYYLIGEKGKDGAVYCIGSGRAEPLKNYINQMARLTGAREPKIGVKPYPENAVMNLCADISSLQRDTGFSPQYTFEEGIQETIAWIKGQNGVGNGKENIGCDTYV